MTARTAYLPRATMKLLALLVVAVALTCPLVQAQDDTVADISDFAVYKDHGNRFSLRYPAEAELLDLTGTACFGARSGSPLGGDLRVFSLHCKPLGPDDTNAEELALVLDTPHGIAQFLDGFRDTADYEFEYLSHELSRLGGLSAVRVMTRLTIPAGAGPVVLHLAQYMADSPDQAGMYIFGCGSLELDGGRALCDKMASAVIFGPIRPILTFQ